MNRVSAVRTIITTMMMAGAWLLAPAASFAQVIHVQPYVQPGDGSVLTGKDVKVIEWLTDQTPGNFVVEFFDKKGTIRTAKPTRVSLDFRLPPPEKKKDGDKKPEPGKDEPKDKTKDEPKGKELVKEDSKNVKEPAKDDPKIAKDKTKDDPKTKEPAKGDPKIAKDKTKDDPKTKEPAKDDPKVAKDKHKDKEKVPPPVEKSQFYYRYTADLKNLPFNTEITYRVKLGDKVIRQAKFRTRASADKTVRCVLVGDLAQGRNAQKEIAYRISLEKPEFLMALGDIVYPTGRVNQYMAYYWGTYNNVAKASLKTGAPLMASVPFYPVLGNHDVGAKLDKKTPDALGVYQFFAPPKNGPGEGPWNTPLDVNAANYKSFRAQTANSFPYIDTYSFDNGPAHFVVINTNRPLNVPIFQKWLVDDLKSTKAKWKFVCFHIPGFQSSKSHYPEQQVRALQPIFEECGVDITFAGHVHNYQRTVPLKFVPSTNNIPAKGKKAVIINGTFTLDSKFDGIKNTHPDGVIHIVAGGGGASLYGPGLDKTSADLKKDYGPDNYVDFTARMVVDKHSFVVMDIAPDRLDLKALGANGTELDRITITKQK